jgi:hypothetical protein
MNTLSAFDLAYAARQLAFPVMALVAPALLAGWFLRRRLLLSVVLPVALMAWAGLIVQTWWSISRLWAAFGGPSNSARIGPSYLTLIDAVWLAPVTLWLPFGLSFSIWWRWSRRKRLVSDRDMGWFLCSYMVVGTLFLSAILSITEYDHEDTVFASGFRLARWNQMRAGMTRAQIYEALGPPLDHRMCAFAPDAECWVSNNTAGHFAAVWFEQDKARRVRRWYSD